MRGSIGKRLWAVGMLLASLAPDTADAASSVEIVGDTLVIAGTPEDDRILIKATRDPGAVRVIFNGARLGHFGPVAGVEVDAGAGDDTVLVSGALELPVRLYGGDGDDRLRGGGGPDLVFGEHGDDVLTASRGRDALDGGPGGNRLRLKRSMGEVRIGATAGGDALRILDQAYDLRPLDPRQPRSARSSSGPPSFSTTRSWSSCARPTRRATRSR